MIEPPVTTKFDLSPESEPAKADNSSSFGQRLKLERLRRQLSQQEVATHCGVARTTQNSYEKDKRSPGLDYVQKLGELGFNLPYLLNAKPPPPSITEGLQATPEALGNAYRIVDEFCVDSAGNRLPLESRLQFFQLLCMTMHDDCRKDSTMGTLRDAIKKLPAKGSTERKGQSL